MRNSSKICIMGAWCVLDRWMFNQPHDDDYDFTTILKPDSIALIGRSRDLLQPQGSVHASREADGTQMEPATPVSATGLLISPCQPTLTTVILVSHATKSLDRVLLD
jgi:hypothetical protein